MKCVAFYLTVFKKFAFSPVHTRNDAYALLKPFLKVSIHRRFGVDDRRKRMEKYAFSNENT